MKKAIAFVLTLCMIFALAACGQSAAPEAPSAPETGDASAAPEAPATGEFPSKTISFIIPYAAGDGLDLTCRAMLESIDLPVNTIVENITGASGTIGLQEAFGRPSDGYTVAILSNGPIISQPLLNDTLTYDLESWKPLCFITGDTKCALCCNSQLGIKNSDDALEFFKSGKTFTVGVGNMTGFTFVAIADMFTQLGIMDNVQFISYDGASALYQAYLSGEIDFAGFDDYFAAQYRAAGDDVIVAVVCGQDRSEFLPDVASAGEWGLDMSAHIGFKAAAVPADTPDEVCEYLYAKIREAVLSEEYQNWCKENYYTGTSDEALPDPAGTMETLKMIRDVNIKVLTAAGVLEK